MDTLDELVLAIGIIISGIAVASGILEVSIPFGHENLAILGVVLVGLGFVLLVVDL